MKKLVLILLVIFSVYFSSVASQIVATGRTNSVFGDYQIVALDGHVMMNGKELDKFLIRYEKGNLEMIVVLDKQQRCMKYYVLSGKYPVQYECNGLYFGIEKMDAVFADMGYPTPGDTLNGEEFCNQTVLTPDPATSLDHLRLIAYYYPGLFKRC